MTDTINRIDQARARMDSYVSDCGAAQQPGVEIIQQLATLKPLEYDQERKHAAKKLEVRTVTLDREVAKLREPENREQGTAALFTAIEPWPHEVDGAECLDNLSDSCKRFMALPDHGDTALSLWVLFTHLIDAVEVAPILAVTAPEKRCGKTTCLEWLGRLANRPLPASNITVSALFRAVEKWRPTLLIDEADTFLKNSDELRGIINSGHTKQSAFVIRTVGDEYEPRLFSTWSAKAIAMIGSLPDTTADRSIHLEMRRKLAHEHIDKMREAGDHFMELQRKCSRWACDNIHSLNESVSVPGALHDRAADNWRPLIAIADLSGGKWPVLARQAAITLTGRTDNESTSTELLRDIREIFKNLHDDRISTTVLIEKLVELEEAPWATWNRGKPISPRQIAKRLREFGITSNVTVRFSDKTAKGYKLDQFEDDFTRYLSVTPSQTLPGAGFSPIAIGNTDNDVTDKKTLRVKQDKGCNPVTATEGEPRIKEAF